MKNKLFYLSTCNTCKRIISELDGKLNNVVLQDVKENHITEEELDFIASKSESYEQLFNKRAVKYRSLGLKEMNLSEEEWKSHILNEYTFLKRPLSVIDGQVFAGNSKKTIEALKNHLDE